MKLELRENMYIRTKDGYISQYKYYDTTNAYMKKLLCIPLNNGTFANIEDIVKASHNIIDLIEVGDYVNGEKVIRIDKDPFIKGQINLWTNTITSNYWGDISLSPIIEKDIKSIVTKEMFSSMEYRLGDDK